MGRKSQKGKTAGNGTGSNKTRERTQSPPFDSDINKMEPRLAGKHLKHQQKVTKTRSQVKDNFESDENEANLFPKYSYWIVFAWTLTLRVWYVTSPANWWILHPDEVYQTIEVAHTDAFDYGFRTYEYIPPPGNKTYSDAHAQSTEMGMYSLRSFLIVKALSIVMVIADRCGLPWSPYLLTKIVHAFITSFLPVSVYKFTKVFYRSRDTAVLASIFTSFSLTLNVFGTHTLINSFLSTFVFLALTPFVKVLNTCVQCNQDKYIAATNSSFSPTQTKNMSHVNGSIEPIHNLNRIKSSLSNQNSDILPESNYHITDEKGAKNENSYTNGHIPNGHVSINTSYQVQEKGVFSWVSYILALRKCNPKFAERYSSNDNGYQNGDINANITTKKTKHCDMSFTDLINKTEENVPPWCIPKLGEIKIDSLKIYDILFGILFGLLAYSRTDLILLPAVFFVLYLDIVLKNLYRFLCNSYYYMIGLCTALIVGGFFDNLYYGVWFITIKQWLKFNIFSGLSSFVFGEGSTLFYLFSIFELEPFSLLVCGVILVDIFVFHSSSSDQKSKYSLYGDFNNHRNTAYTFYMLLFIYSLTGHKEYRFIHNVIVMLYISFARSVFNLCQTCIQFASPENQNKPQYYTCFIYSMLAIVFSSHIYKFVSMDTNIISKWTYRGEVDADVNYCMDFIRKQTDVNGIFMDRSIYTTGGYSLLQHDVPWFALNMNEFVEFDHDSLFIDSGYFSHSTNSSFYIVDRISEFVSIYNTPHVVKILIEKPHYNYLILDPERRFLDIGYEKLFATKKAIVLRRTFNKGEEKELRTLATRQPIGNNATILEYEGQWLNHFGLFKKAEQRLLASMRIERKRLGPFQILLMMFHQLGEREKYASVMKSCMELFTSEQCRSPHKPIKLHQEYYRSIV